MNASFKHSMRWQSTLKHRYMVLGTVPTKLAENMFFFFGYMGPNRLPDRQYKVPFFL